MRKGVGDEELHGISIERPGPLASRPLIDRLAQKHTTNGHISRSRGERKRTSAQILAGNRREATQRKINQGDPQETDSFASPAAGNVFSCGSTNFPFDFRFPVVNPWGGASPQGIAGNSREPFFANPQRETREPRGISSYICVHDVSICSRNTTCVSRATVRRRSGPLQISIDRGRSACDELVDTAIAGAAWHEVSVALAAHSMSRHIVRFGRRSAVRPILRMDSWVQGDDVWATDGVQIDKWTRCLNARVL